MTTVPIPQAPTLLQVLLRHASNSRVKFWIRKTGNYQYIITFEQPWHIQRIEAICEQELLQEFSV